MEQKEYRLAAVVFTDIVGFSSMMERDEQGTLSLLNYHNELIHGLAVQHGGKVIKTIGDALLLDFPNTVNAVKCAIEIQRAIFRHNLDEPERTLALRIGVHLGDIYFYDNDALGEGINIASRLQSVAKPGRICISQDVYNLVSNKIDLRVSHLGEVKLKNISRAIHAFEIIIDGEAEQPGYERPPDDSLPERRESSGGSWGTESRSEKSRELDVAEMKDLVLKEIKHAGRRLSVSEVRARLRITSEEFDSVLEGLAAKGFLSRGGSADAMSDASVGPGFGPWSPEFWRGGRSWDSRQFARNLRDQVRGEIDRIRRETETDRYARRHRRHPDRRGWEDKEEDKRIEKEWDDALSADYGPWSEAPGTPGQDPLIDEYRKQTNVVADKIGTSFRSHLGSFVGVNAMLFAIWLFTGAHFPWFLIPLGGWGIGIATHYGAWRRKRREAAELNAAPVLSREHLRTFRELNKVRTGWGAHLWSNLAVIGFLFMLNMITSPGVPWFAIPAGAMAIGLFSHFPAFKGKETRLKRRLAELGIQLKDVFRRGGSRSPASAAESVRASADMPLGQQAAIVKDAILAQLKTFDKKSQPLGEDFVPLLENYVNQIQELSEKDIELERIINEIPIHELERDLVQLNERRTKADDKRVIAEYDRSIEQIERQQRSFRELKNEKEMLQLRSNSALNSLKQMQIDLARMKSMSSQADAGALGLLKEKSSELSQYLEDLGEGYKEIE